MGPRSLQHCENFSGIIVLQFVGCLLSCSMVELMATFSKRVYAIRRGSQVCCSQSPCPCSRPQLIRASTGDTQTLKCRSGSSFVGPLGPGVHKVLFESSERLWWVWGLVLMRSCPSYCLVGVSSSALGCGVPFLVESGTLLPMNVQQPAAVLEFLQKMSTRASTLPSYNCVMNFNFKSESQFHWLLHLRLNYFLLHGALLSSFRPGLMGHFSGL